MSIWMRRIRQSAILAVIVVLVFFATVVASTFRHPPRNLVENPGIEEPVDASNLPKDWSFVTNSGDYIFEVTKSTNTPDGVRSGSAALSFGGSGGSAELRTNPIKVPGGCVVECDGWLKNELVRGGRVCAIVRLPDADSSTPSSYVQAIDPKSSDWQRVHFFAPSGGTGSVEVSPVLAVHLDGEALVRVDDLALTVDPQLILADVIKDKGFESPDENGNFSEWTHCTAEGGWTCKKFTESPRSGATCVRLQGVDEWAVLVGKSNISAKHSRVILQAFVRVTGGVAQLQLDYQSFDKKVARVFSKKVEKSDEWTLVVLESDPGLMARSTSVSFALTVFGSPDDPYVVDFDDVEVFDRK